MGTHLRVHSMSFVMLLTWQGLNGFQKILRSCTLDESSLSIGKVNFFNTKFFPIYIAIWYYIEYRCQSLVMYVVVVFSGHEGTERAGNRLPWRTSGGGYVDHRRRASEGHAWPWDSSQPAAAVSNTRHWHLSNFSNTIQYWYFLNDVVSYQHFNNTAWLPGSWFCYIKHCHLQKFPIWKADFLHVNMSRKKSSWFYIVKYYQYCWS